MNTFTRWSLFTSWIAVLCVLGLWSTAHATLISFTNTSSSYYELRNDATSAIIADNTNREGATTYDLPDGQYRLYLGQVGDEGSHAFKITGGQVDYYFNIPPTQFFTNYSPTSITIGSIPVYFRLLSGPNQDIIGGAGNAYFAPQFLNVGGPDGAVNLTPTDAPLGFGFVGNWKNVFPSDFSQHTPFQLGPNGIVSMTGDGTNNPAQTTIVPSSVVLTNFGRYEGFVFTVKRADSSQPGDNSVWLYYSIPELSTCTLGLFGLGCSLLLRLRRRA